MRFFVLIVSSVRILWFQFSGSVYFLVSSCLSCVLSSLHRCLVICHFLFYFLVFVSCALCFSFAYLVSSSYNVASGFPTCFIASCCPVHVFIVWSSFVLMLWTPCILVPFLFLLLSSCNKAFFFLVYLLFLYIWVLTHYDNWDMWNPTGFDFRATFLILQSLTTSISTPV